MASTLTSYRAIRGTIRCETGLRIGGSNEHVEIGELENTIVRHPISDEPYIPGSTLKGKLRSLLEYRYDWRDSRSQPKGQGGRDDGDPDARRWYREADDLACDGCEMDMPNGGIGRVSARAHSSWKM